MKNLFLAVLLLAGAAAAQEPQLISVLKSSASLKEKADACRTLARIGTSQSVLVLATLLTDEQLSHVARIALEPIPDPSVDVALREALGKVKGRLLLGVIDSVGVRKDPNAVAPLSQLLTDSDSAVAQAAARSLGSIGGAAAAVLERALSTNDRTNQLAVCEGLLRCAEQLNGSEATAIYDKLRNVPGLPHHVRVAALSGAIRTRGSRGLPLMLEAIRTEAYVPAADAIRVSMDLQGPEVTQALVGAITNASDETQLLLLQALGNRGDDSAAPALLRLAKQGSPNRRAAAIRALVQLAPPAALPLLAGLARDSEPSVSSAALTGLTGFPGGEADAMVETLLHKSDGSLRARVIDIVAQRRITNATPALLKLAAEAEPALATASFKALGELAEVPDITSIMDAMVQTKALSAAEAALATICGRQPEPGVCTDKLLPGLEKAQGEPKLALLRVLGGVADPKALEAVRAASTDPEPGVKETAVRLLCDWPNADALPVLAQIGNTPQESRFKLLALRGQLRLIPLQNAPPAQKVSQLKELLPSLENQEEKRLALAALGDLPSPESLAVITPFLSNERLKEEASVAAVTVGEKIATSHPAEVAAAMKQVQTKNTDLDARAKKLLARVEGKSGPK